MSRPSKIIKERLMAIIRQMTFNPEPFVKKPGKDFSRKRKLPLDKMLILLLGMGGGSLQTELLRCEGYTADTATTSAFIQQRDKILVLALEHILHEFTQAPAKVERYKGYRLFAVDGSDLHPPTNPEDLDNFIQGHPGEKGYNLLHLNALYDLCNRIFIDALIQNKRCLNEFAALATMVDRSLISEPAILIADRGYECYNSLAHIEQKGWKYLIRIKDIPGRGILTGVNLPESPEFDVCVQRIVTRVQNKQVKAKPELYRCLPSKATFDFLDRNENRFYPMSFRIVRFKITDDTYETVVTNLDSEQFSPSELKNLYCMRWGIETAFRALKYTVGIICFHSKKTEYISQEVFASLIMYNFSEMIASCVIIQRQNTRYDYRINFSLAVQICKHFFSSREMAHPPDVEALILANTLPVRNGRCFPRKVRFRQAVGFNYRIS
jgi:hypothetical protein